MWPCSQVKQGDQASLGNSRANFSCKRPDHKLFQLCGDKALDRPCWFPPVHLLHNPLRNIKTIVNLRAVYTMLADLVHQPVPDPSLSTTKMRLPTFVNLLDTVKCSEMTLECHNICHLPCLPDGVWLSSSFLPSGMVTCCMICHFYGNFLLELRGLLWRNSVPELLSLYKSLTDWGLSHFGKPVCGRGRW